MFELHKIQGKHHVKIFYREGHSKQAELLHESPLDEFKVKYRHVMPTETFEKECIVKARIDLIPFLKRNIPFKFL